MKLAEIAARLGCDLEGDGSIEVTGLAPIENAEPGTLTFLANPRYREHLAQTRAAAVILGADAPPTSLPVLRAADPYLAFAEAIDLFYVPPRLPQGIHPSAVVAASARIGAGARIGPHCVVGDDVVLGERACLDAHVVLYPEVVAGDDFRAQAHVTVRERVRIGHRVTLQPGCVIGSDGFGYVAAGGGIRKIVQAGTVVIEDDAEIGANTTVDRAAVGVTRIGAAVKIDNLVQIAHGCEVGAGSMFAAQVGLSGSTRVGRFVRLGGQAATAGHQTIGDGVTAAARSGIIHDVEPGATIGGFPEQPLAQFRRTVAALARIPDALRRLRRIEKHLDLRDGAGRDESSP